MSGIVTIITISLVLLIVWYLIVLLVFYKKVTQGEAIIRTGLGGTKIVFDRGILVIPIFHKLEKIDLTIKKIEIHRTDSFALLFKNHEQMQLKAAFFVRVHKNNEDIIKVAQTFGCQRTFESEEVCDLFRPKFEEALKAVAFKFSYENILKNRDMFRNEILERLGTDHNGYIIDDCAIYDFVERETKTTINKEINHITK